jgi:hypothetical protein
MSNTIVSMVRWARNRRSTTPYYQLPDEAVPAFGGQVTLAVRTPLDLAAMMPAIKKAVYEAGADQPVYNIQTMQEIVSQSMGRQRFPTLLLVAFAGLALVLDARACGFLHHQRHERLRMQARETFRFLSVLNEVVAIE